MENDENENGKYVAASDQVILTDLTNRLGSAVTQAWNATDLTKLDGSRPHVLYFTSCMGHVVASIVLTCIEQYKIAIPGFDPEMIPTLIEDAVDTFRANLMDLLNRAQNDEGMMARMANDVALGLETRLLEITEEQKLDPNFDVLNFLKPKGNA